MNHKMAVNVAFLQHRLDELRNIDAVKDSNTDAGLSSHDGDGTGDGTGTLSERLSRLEGVFEGWKSSVDGLRHGQNWTLGAIAILSAFVIGLGAYTLNRIDVVNEKVDALPSQINSNLLQITQTLASSITATKQQSQTLQPTLPLAPKASKKP